MPREPGAPQPLLLVYLGTMLSLTGVQLVVPSFPTLRTAFELSNADVALLMTLFLGPAAVATIPAGVLADRWGRKRMMVLMLTVFGLAGIVAFTAPSFAVLLGARIVQGAAFGVIQPMGIALIADLRTGRAQAQAQGYGQVAMNLGETLLPAIGGVLTLLDWRAAFAGQSVTLVIAWLIHRHLDVPQLGPTASDPDHPTPSTWRILFDPPVLGLVAAGGLRFTLKYGMLTFVPLVYAAAHGDNPVAIGLLLALAASLSVVGALGVPRFLDLFRASHIVLIGIAGGGTAVGLLGVHDAVWLIALAAVLYGLCDGSGGVAQKALLSVAGGVGARGTVLSLAGASNNVGKFLGPAAIGAFTGLLSISGIVLTIGLGAVAATALLRPIGRVDHLIDRT